MSHPTRNSFPPQRWSISLRLVLGIAIWCGPAAGQWVAADAPSKPNVLMILVDDLKPALGCYGDSDAKSPNIDRLAARAMRFDKAYCNQSVCAPSRFTLMLGSHSTTTGLYDLSNNLRRCWPEAVTLPQHFAKHGYRTESMGKVFHIGHGNQGDPESFMINHDKEKVVEYLDPQSTLGGKLTREEALFTNQQLGNIGDLPRGAAFESVDVPDEAYADGRVAALACQQLGKAKARREKTGTPFFMAVGFVRPHLPFCVPKRYWDAFDPDQLPQPSNPHAPRDAPKLALKRGGEIVAYEPVPPSGDVDPKLARKLIHGYYASVHYVDHQIGKVMDEFERLGLFENTIVVLWGDHGYHLGDLGIWTKHTNFEQANRIPLLICSPQMKPGVTQQLAESVDVFPTLAELAGIQPPSGPPQIDGVSLVRVLGDPSQRVRDHAYHAYPKERLGRAIRTERYRLVQWKRIGSDPAPIFELYDYQTDPHETENIASSHPEIVHRLLETLEAYPPPVENARNRVTQPSKR